MFVFIDESGDPGFKLDRGSTPIFAAAMVVFESKEAAQHADAVIRQALVDLRAAPEFKFNKSRDQVRDGFFAAVADCDFCVRAIVVRKEIIHSDRLRSEKEEFYRFFVKNMVKYDGGLLHDAKVIIDGSGERVFQQDLQRHLKKHADGGIKSVKFAASHRDPLVQLADMSVGAVARSFRKDRKNSDRWRQQLGRKLQDVWEFG
ncbi:DUF3800 domain-containing protein [Novosphingobium sp.]|uniref:DUF3800 domain-containing protein n=1 Tax=Novosphingobium sp. TaxID=1874826 RepID=UPI0025F30DD0|nr:DUF3800 domain-containing protein [Novosphingobium sp.]MCC6927314.1 DUF3800 domain-containing protein [Novosphingobium sp.]